MNLLRDRPLSETSEEDNLKKAGKQGREIAAKGIDTAKKIYRSWTLP